MINPSIFDHTNLDPAASPAAIEKLCDEALRFGFASVCVQPYYVPLAKRLLNNNIAVTTVIGFPLGQNVAKVKLAEAQESLAAGADEFDVVINYAALKAGDLAVVREELSTLRQLTAGKILKVIFETSQLTDEEIVSACQICQEIGVDFVKTSTGFRGEGATVHAVSLMRQHFSGGVKASGGIRTADDVRRMIEAGATRIGASASVAIVGEDK